MWERICTTAIPRLGFDMLSSPDHVPPPNREMHSTASGLPFSILQKASDFLTLSASLLLCQVRGTTLTPRLTVRIGWLPSLCEPQIISREPHRRFHCVEGPARCKGLVGPSAYSSSLIGHLARQGSRSSPSKQGRAITLCRVGCRSSGKWDSSIDRANHDWK